MTLEDTISKRNAIQSNGTLWLAIKGVKGQGGNQSCFSKFEAKVSIRQVGIISNMSTPQSISSYPAPEGPRTARTSVRVEEEAGKIMTTRISSMLGCYLFTYAPI